MTGRVIDVLYMVENQEYAKHMINYAETVEDAELQRHVNSLNVLIDAGKSQTTVSADEIIPNNTETASKTTLRNNQATWFLG